MVEYLPQLIVYIMSLSNDIKSLIDKALALGVNLKILDLIVRNEYLGNGKRFHDEDAVLSRWKAKI